MDPNGKIPDMGIINIGDKYQGAAGIGLGILLTRHGVSVFRTKCLPKIVPKTDKGNDTNVHRAIILRITLIGNAPIVS